MRGNNIIEYQDETTLYYILMEKELFDYIEYKVLNEQKEKGFVKCGRVLYNGKVKIVYNISGYSSLKWMLERGLSTEKFLEIVKLLVDKLKEVESIGYMHLWNVVLDFEKIFVDSNQNLCLIYRPLKIKENYQTITALKKRLLSTIQYYGYGGEMIMRLQNVLRLETAQLNELCSVFRSAYMAQPNLNDVVQETKTPTKHKFLDVLKGGNHHKKEKVSPNAPEKSNQMNRENRLGSSGIRPGGTSNNSVNINGMGRNSVRLDKTLNMNTLNQTHPPIQIQNHNTNFSQQNGSGEIKRNGNRVLKCRQENFSIKIDSEKKLLLGKQVTEHGVSIPFNPAISKLHAKIFEQNGEYYIVDLESKNGTFINGIRLVPIVAKVIRPGDTIRLANTDFDFIIE